MQVLDSGKKSAQENMSLDTSLLEQLGPQDQPVLHMYEWKQPSLTYGYFIALDKYLNVGKQILKKKNIEIKMFFLIQHFVKFKKVLKE